MDILELEHFHLEDAVKFHDDLNPALWDGKSLKPEVRRQLLLIAEDFIQYLGIRLPDIKDITISGSNAAYTYTDHSDIDLHILVDMTKLPDDDVYQELFTAKKTLYNDDHKITIKGIPVELYVQDSNKPVVSIGEYSLMQEKWLKQPTKTKANFNQSLTKAKYEKLGGLIELALKYKNEEQVDRITKLIKRYRQAGLDMHGEFGPENLSYKALRAKGYIKALYNLKQKLHGEKLSVREQMLDQPTITVDELIKKYGESKVVKQLELGIKTELEHTTDLQTALQIALAHMGEDINYYTKLSKAGLEEASGYIPSNAEKNDKRFKTALTIDVKPDSIKKNAKAFGFNIKRAGIPPTLNPSGKYRKIK